ncbi:hypothetical protein JV34_22720 [Pectobacterium atrosepticum]|nr:hypothetical protein JV34_22720 [Pectobacterium atrosepticum]
MIDKSNFLLVSPTTGEVKQAREKTGLSPDEIAGWFGLTDGSAWRKKEISKKNSMNRRLLKVMEYEMLLLLSDSHPKLKLVSK